MYNNINKSNDILDIIKQTYGIQITHSDSVFSEIDTHTSLPSPTPNSSYNKVEGTSTIKKPPLPLPTSTLTDDDAKDFIWIFYAAINKSPTLYFCRAFAIIYSKTYL